MDIEIPVKMTKESISNAISEYLRTHTITAKLHINMEIEEQPNNKPKY